MVTAASIVQGKIKKGKQTDRQTDRLTDRQPKTSQDANDYLKWVATPTSIQSEGDGVCFTLYSIKFRSQGVYATLNRVGACLAKLGDLKTCTTSIPRNLIYIFYLMFLNISLAVQLLPMCKQDTRWQTGRKHSHVYALRIRNLWHAVAAVLRGTAAPLEMYFSSWQQFQKTPTLTISSQFQVL